MPALPPSLPVHRAPSSSKLPAPADAYIPWAPDAHPAPLDLDLAAPAPPKGRQHKFVESVAQRRQRVEFLRRGEWTRRIAEWIDSAAGAEAKALAPITYSWVDILAAADADDDYYEDPPLPPPPQTVPYPYAQDEQDAEPYIIYTASPRSSPAASAPSLPYTPPPAPYPARPPALPMPSAPTRRRSGPSPRSRHSSLSSISEEDEPCF